MVNILELLDNYTVTEINSFLKGKQLIYKSNANFSCKVEFQFMSLDTFQINGAYNPNNCFLA